MLRYRFIVCASLFGNAQKEKMADDDGKQTFIADKNADTVENDADLLANGSSERRVSVETTETANERINVTVSQDVDVSLDGDAQASCKRVDDEGQSESANLADVVKVVTHRRKRNVVHERAASTDAETPVKRRRVLHNYRRLSSAGYVDDYDGRERFSGKQTTAPARKSLSSLKSKSADSLPVSRQLASKMTRSRSKTDTNAIQGQFEFDRTHVKCETAKFKVDVCKVRKSGTKILPGKLFGRP